MKIATFINYCSTDYMFLKPCIQSVKSFSSEIIVAYCNRFFNGDPENWDIIAKSIEENPDAKFMQFEFSAGKYKEDGCWQNRARAEAWLGLKDKDVDYFLIIDVDEIADPKFEAFLELLHNNEDFKSYDSFRILGYWYFMDIKYRAQQLEPCAVLIRNKSDINFDFFEKSPGERLGLLHGKFANNACLRDSEGRVIPLFHHYSWVRTRQQMLQKVKGWGHSGERDWAGLINNFFDTVNFDGTQKDFVHGYDFDTVEPLEVFKA